MRVALVEVWLGKIPDYFQYHLKSIEKINTIDFYFFTDDIEYVPIKTNNNFHYAHITESQFLNRFNNTSPIKFTEIKNRRKIIDFKLSYFEMFSDLLGKYDYVGIYDIDTLFGNIDPIINNLNDVDFVSIGNKRYHNRLSGPFLLLKNKVEILNLIKTPKYYETLNDQEIYGYGENDLSNVAFNNYKVLLIDQINVLNDSGKIDYEVVWNNGHLYNNQNQELFFYHFYHKNYNKFCYRDQIIGTYFKKPLVEDFYWVTYFTESYERFVIFLLESIKKYSNRKCILYSVNYDSKLSNDIKYCNAQFLFKRIDIESGIKDQRGRDLSILTLKPKVFIDVIENFPEKKFVQIDSDMFLTTNADNISKFFINLENYPLSNSHVHDVIYCSNVVPNQEWTSSLHVLLSAENIEIDPLYPRRKTNVVIYDNRSKWFFYEQIELYKKYYNSNIPGILHLHDEDTFNFILTKYGLNKCLPLLDIEETYDLSLDQLNKYSYNIITPWISPSVILPKTINDFLFFHGFKSNEDYENIKNNYCLNVLDADEIILNYSNQTITFEKNTFLSNKTNLNLVDFIVKTINGNEIFRLTDQHLLNYHIFYISNISLENGKYLVEIINKQNNQKIYQNFLEVKNELKPVTKIKKVALVSTFCDTPEKLKVLKNNVKTVKELGIDVICISPFVIDKEIIELCDYFFITKDNPILDWPIKSVGHWIRFFNKNHTITLTATYPDYGYASLSQVKQLSQIALQFDYDQFFHMIYDINIDHNVLHGFMSNSDKSIYGSKRGETTWTTSLHFMIFDRLNLNKFISKINIDSYLSNYNYDAFTWLYDITKECDFKIEDIKIEDLIFYGQNINYHDHSPISDITKVFIGKNTKTYENIRLLFYDVHNQNVQIKVNDKIIYDTIHEFLYVNLDFDPNNIKKTSLVFNGDEYDLTFKIINLKHTEITYI